ncbi:MAG: hypothetical protein KDD69_14375, partial [Bdellovibrionales bacterium]|nr:hypothetical protein [Bdellovibrionales bacterium]
MEVLQVFRKALRYSPLAIVALIGTAVKLASGDVPLVLEDPVPGLEVLHQELLATSEPRTEKAGTEKSIAPSDSNESPGIPKRVSAARAILREQPFVGREAVAHFVSYLEKDGVPADRVLVESIQQRDEVSGVQLALALRSREARERLAAAAAVSDLLASEKLDHRLQAAEAVGIIGSVDQGLEERLIRLTRDDEPRLRFRAVAALSRLFERSPRAERAIREALTDPVLQVRARAAAALGLEAARDAQAPAALGEFRETNKFGLWLAAAGGYRLGQAQRLAVGVATAVP